MSIAKLLWSTKAQLVYIVVVLLFNITAIYYLFFFSNTKINIATFLPNPTLLEKAIIVPITEVFKKFTFTYQAPKKAIAKPTAPITPTEQTATPTSEENDLINCTGPDGKQVWLTQKDCAAFNSAWVATSSASPTQTASQAAASN